MNVLSTVPSDWALIAEGGANLVLSYSGSDASFSSLVLRVRKRKLHAVSEAEDDDEDPAVAFNEQVVDKLMPGLSASLWNASVDEPFLQALAAQVEPHRRPTRREEDELDTKRTRVVLAEDLVSPRIPGERVLTVEIKPKWGFMPSKNAPLSPETEVIKRSHCRFCMHQLLKTDASSASLSNDRYCPLDLYSQDEQRVKRAVEALQRDWHASNGKGNNFRLFLDGIQTSPSDPQCASLLADLLPSVSSSNTSLTNLVTSALLSSPLLPRLKHLQAMFDSQDIEGLLLAFTTLSDTSLAEADADHLLSTLDLPARPGFTPVIPPQSNSTIQQQALAYLISASLKDCSILLRFTKDGVKVKAIDIDPKPVTKLPGYARLDREIVDFARGKVDGMKSCVDRAS